MNPKQSPRQSFIETLTQVTVKGVTATGIWCLIRPYAMDIPPVCVTLIFMVNSFTLGYAIRRVLNRSTK